ncbi:MAG: serine hydrolase domain-containing protein [Phenylobacterium sp.]
MTFHTTGLRAAIDGGDLAGAVTLVWRRGEIVQRTAEGWADREAGRPMRGDSLFRIASMTKPITSALAMMLVEEGALSLSDPITRWAPEFAEMRVLRSPTGPLDDTYTAARPITVDDLLTHRSGLTYGFLAQGPIAGAYTEALGSLLDSRLEPDAWIAALARLPLACAPGERFCYGHSTDLLGFILARIAGMDLAELMARRILRPLGMADTGFAPPADDRAAVAYGVDEDGGLVAQPVPPRPAGTRFTSAGQGLWSTAGDYLTFARLLLGGGQVDGVRLLRQESVALMLADSLAEPDRRAMLMGMPMFAGHGFGRGLAVVRDRDRAAPMLGTGRPGAFGWPGALWTWWQADPAEEMILIWLVQNTTTPARLASGKGLGAYMAQFSFERAAYGAFAGA